MSGRRRASAPAIRKEAQTFSRGLTQLFARVLKSTYLMNCEPAALLLAEHKAIFPGALIWAADKSRGFTLGSLSYLILRGRITSLTETNRPLQQIINSLPASDTKLFVCKGSMSQCAILVKNGRYRRNLASDLRSFGRLYDHMVLSSHNYRNYVAGDIYFNGKSKEEAAAYPLFNSVEEVCDKLVDTYGVRARHFVYVGSRHPSRLRLGRDFLTYDRETIARYCRRPTLPATFVRDLQDAVRRRQSRVGRLGDARSPFYAIFPVYDPNVRGPDFPPEGIVIVLSRSAPDIFVMRAAEEWLTAFSSKRHIQKAIIIPTSVDRANEEIKTIGTEASVQARLAAFGRIGQHLCDAICKWTPAASVTVRRFDRLGGQLTKVAAAQSTGGHYDATILERQSHERIPVDMTADSFNAFAVSYAGKDKVLYIEDVDSIPPEYAQHGFRKILPHHPLTHTEAVARVIAGKRLVALINVEAPVSGALRHHRDFFGECADFLGEIHRRLFSLSDNSGLATMARSHLALHSVADMLEKWTDGDALEAITIVRRLQQIQSGSIDTADNSDIAFPTGPNIGADVARFNSGLRSWITHVLHRKGNYAHDANSILHGYVPRDVPASLIPTLFVITTSIMENIIYRPSWDRHSVRFLHAANGYVSKRQLTILWSSDEWLDDELGTDSILIQPMIDANGNKHFGFFLVGVYARQAGGTAEFAPTGARHHTGFKLLVTLPYDPE